MAQLPANPKIEELRFRLKTDPKSRLFYPLAEELRKVKAFEEAEQVLRGGLGNHPTYLSAWVSLGRVLRERGKNAEAAESLAKAMQLDPGNVVAARLLADAYLDLGEKVEAIKKYKLVHALLPTDEDIVATIARLELELNPPQVAAAEAAPEPEAAPEDAFDQTMLDAPPPFGTDETRVFSDAAQRMAEEQRVEVATADVEPMSAAHEDSPFEDDSAPLGYGSDAFAVEEPQGVHVTRAPLVADLAMPVVEEQPVPVETAPPIAPEPLSQWDDAAADAFGATPDAFSSSAEAMQAPLKTTESPFDVTLTDAAETFAPAGEYDAPFAAPPEATPFAETTEMPFPSADAEAPVDAEPEDFTNTITMADLYARQGLIADARNIYEHILQRDPENVAVREKLEALPPDAAAPAPQPEPESLWDTQDDEASAPLTESPFAMPEEAPASPAIVAALDAAVPSVAARNAKVARLEAWLAKVGRKEVPLV